MYFGMGLRLEIQQAVSYMQITDFSQLVTKCRIFEDKMKERQARGVGGPQRNHPFRGNGEERTQRQWEKCSQVEIQQESIL